MSKLRYFPLINCLIALLAIGVSGAKDGPTGFLLLNVAMLAVAGLVYQLQHGGARKAIERGEATIRPWQTRCSIGALECE